VPEAVNVFGEIAAEPVDAKGAMHSFEYSRNGFLLRVDAPGAAL
jgi:hypothetical protein